MTRNKPGPEGVIRVAVATALLLGPALAPADASAKTCRVDRAQYEALKAGMTYAKVRARLGCAGKRVSHLKIGRIRRATYSWPAEGTYGANLTLTFRQGRLTDKAQLGLR